MARKTTGAAFALVFLAGTVSVRPQVKRYRMSLGMHHTLTGLYSWDRR